MFPSPHDKILDLPTFGTFTGTHSKLTLYQNNKLLDRPNLEAFTEYNTLYLAKILEIFSESVENFVEKGENAGNQKVPTRFSKGILTFSQGKPCFYVSAEKGF